MFRRWNDPIKTTLIFNSILKSKIAKVRPKKKQDISFLDTLVLANHKKIMVNLASKDLFQ